VNLKEMLRGADLPVTPRHEKWLSENPSPEYSKEALAFASSVLRSDVGGNRRRSTHFRASSLGSCERKQMFSANKIKGINYIDSDLSNIFATGNFMHLKWQMAGLTEGWLSVAEFPVESKIWSFGGTLDGILYDGSLFEYKSINPRGFSNVCEYGPKKDHILQAHGYMHLANLPAVSFVYEDKGSGDWREFRMERDREKEDEILGIIERLSTHYVEETYPEPLKKCLDKEGYVYRQCAFRDVCFEEGRGL